MKARSSAAGVAIAFGVLVSQVLASSVYPKTTEVPLTIIRAHLYLPIALAGQTKQHWWLVDTGSPWSLINTEHAKQLVHSAQGISEQSTTVAGRSCTILVNVRTNVDGYSMGQFDFFEASLAGMLAGHSATEARYRDAFEAGGVLGVNFLARHRALLDFRSQRMSFPDGNVAPMTQRAGFEREGYTYVPVRLTGAGRLEAIGSVGGGALYLKPPPNELHRTTAGERR